MPWEFMPLWKKISYISKLNHWGLIYYLSEPHPTAHFQHWPIHIQSVYLSKIYNVKLSSFFDAYDNRLDTEASSSSTATVQDNTSFVRPTSTVPFGDKSSYTAPLLVSNHS